MPKSLSERSGTQLTPEPALEKCTRRQFKPEYKLRIMAEADACKHGELGALLRREKRYSNQLSAWRREYAQSGIAGLTKSAPAPHLRRSFTQWKGCVNNVVAHRPERLPLTRACHALGLNRSTVYAHQKRAVNDELTMSHRAALS